MACSALSFSDDSSSQWPSQSSSGLAFGSRWSCSSHPAGICMRSIMGLVQRGALRPAVESSDSRWKLVAYSSPCCMAEYETEGVEQKTVNHMTTWQHETILPSAATIVARRGPWHAGQCSPVASQTPRKRSSRPAVGFSGLL